jgi:hypothetical protein
MNLTQTPQLCSTLKLKEWKALECKKFKKGIGKLKNKIENVPALCRPAKQLAQ